MGRVVVEKRRRWVLPLLALVSVAAGGWAFRSLGVPAGQASEEQPNIVRTLRVDVLREFPHDTSAYTQGLLWWNGRLYEATGRYGESTVRRLDPETGAVEHRVDIPMNLFGEGLARVGDQLVMLTWKAGRAMVLDGTTFDVVRSFRYSGEGWGLCSDGGRLLMSNGSDTLTMRSPETFDAIDTVQVTLRGRPQTNLNELECVDGAVYANVWQHDYIVRIDPASGRVTHQIDAAGLLSRREARGVDVLNGIAYSPNTDTFYITGKWWPKMFEVRFVE